MLLLALPGKAGFGCNTLDCYQQHHRAIDPRGVVFALSRMHSAAFSPIMYTAHAMKKPGMRGKTEASTTRKPVVPCTRKSLVRTPPAFRGPMAQVQDA